MRLQYLPFHHLARRRGKDVHDSHSNELSAEPSLLAKNRPRRLLPGTLILLLARHCGQCRSPILEGRIMNFQFVENSKIDGAARKLIRSHVMKGKNVGKTRPRTKHKGQEEIPFPHDSYAGALSLRMPCKSTEANENKIISVPQTIGNSFSFFTFPCQMKPYMREEIYQCENRVILFIPLHLL